MKLSEPSPQVPVIDRLIASVDSRRVAALAVVVCGALAGTLEFITHLAVASLRPPLRFHAGVDALVIAFLTMTLVSVVIAAARARRHQVLQEMRTVAELNHHVRNALQVIRDSHLLPEDRQAQAVIESVERIDSTLRRLFPPATTAYNEKKAELLQSISAGKASEK
jgi:hypothetical protein